MTHERSGTGPGVFAQAFTPEAVAALLGLGLRLAALSADERAALRRRLRERNGDTRVVPPGPGVTWMHGRFAAGALWAVAMDQPGSMSLDSSSSAPEPPSRCTLRVYKNGAEVLRVHLRRGGPGRPGWKAVQELLGDQAAMLEPLIALAGRLTDAWETDILPRPVTYTAEVEATSATEAPGDVRAAVLHALRGLFGEAR